METLTFKDVDLEKRKQTENVYFADVGRVKDTPVYLLGDVSKPPSVTRLAEALTSISHSLCLGSGQLAVGERVVGPAMLIDGTQTIVLVCITSAPSCYPPKDQSTDD